MEGGLKNGDIISPLGGGGIMEDGQSTLHIRGTIVTIGIGSHITGGGEPEYTIFGTCGLETF